MRLEMACPSLELLRRSLDPDDPLSEAERQRMETHVDACRLGLDDDSAMLVGRGYTFAVTGQRAKSLEMLATLTELAKHRYISPDDFGILSIGLGDVDQAFAWMAKAVADRSEWLCKFGVDPVLDPLRSDPRFRELLRLVNGA
jgi:hypothetical protein